MSSEIDYTAHSESELVEIFGRLDPRWAPEECARLAKYLTEHGYIVTADAQGPGSAAPGPAKMQELIGSSTPFECNVDFGPTKALFSGYLLDPATTHNGFRFTGSGSLVCDGVSLWISGHILDRSYVSLYQENTQLACRQIANVESLGRAVRFEYNVDNVAGDAFCLWLADAAAAARVVQVLPQRRTKDFQPHLKE